jgi:tetratricopeptide (TPR) repeat protein
MKPFRRTQVITLMAACAISTVWGRQDDLSEQVQRLKQQAKAMADEAQRSSKIIIDGDQIRALSGQAKALADDVRGLKIAPLGWSKDGLADRVEAMREQAEWMAQDAVRSVDSDVWRIADDAVIAQMDLGHLNLDLLAQDVAPKAMVAPLPPMAPMPPGRAKVFRFDSGSGSYESGKNALDNHNYERAVEIFDKVIDAKNPSSRADGAHYWKAYALNKLGKRDEALATLAELSKQFPQSNWLNDAKALQAEVQQAKGQPVSPENQADEDLKLYAINALINSDADRAVPLLETLLGNPKMSPRLKERALFVLAQSRSDKAHDIVGRYAKGGSNPDLQLTAVQYLGTYRTKESRQLLSEVYASVNDVNVKRAVLRSFEMSRDVEHLTAIAKSEQNVELRREAVRQLGNLHDDQATATLVTIYASESDKDIKSEILNSLASQGAVKQLIECARKESDPELKRTAVRRLGDMRSKEALDFIAELLK